MLSLYVTDPSIFNINRFILNVDVSILNISVLNLWPLRSFGHLPACIYVNISVNLLHVLKEVQALCEFLSCGSFLA